MVKKYEFTGETKQAGLFGEITVKRIRAVVAFGCVEVGELGGWIQEEKNLSHDGDAWVCGDAWVYGNARVCGDARVYGNARVCGNAWVYGNAWVCGNAWVYGNAEVCGDAWVYGNARVCGDARVYGDAWVCGDAWVYGNARVCGDARVCKVEHLLVIGRIGSRSAFTTFFRDKDNQISVRCGCFLGKLDAFLEKVTGTHGESKHALVYKAAVEVAKLQIELDKE